MKGKIGMVVEIKYDFWFFFFFLYDRMTSNLGIKNLKTYMGHDLCVNVMCMDSINLVKFFVDELEFCC